MGVLTWAEAIVDVRQHLGGRQRVTDALATGWLRRSLLHISLPSVFRHPELYGTDEVTLTAADDYEIPETITGRTIAFVAGVRNVDHDYVLRPKDREWFRGQRWTSAGMPSYYLHHGEQGLDLLRVWMAPSAEYQGDVLEVEVYLRPSVAAGDTEATDVTPLAEDWDEAWVAGAVWRGWRWLGQPSMADQVRADAAGLINDLKERLGFEMEEDRYDITIRAPMSAQRFSP